MPTLEQHIIIFNQEFEKALQECTTIETLEELRIHFLGRKGAFTLLNDQFKLLSIEEKRTIGPKLQQIKEAVHQEFERKKKRIIIDTFNEEQKKHVHFDVTASQLPPYKAHSHIYTKIIQDLEDCFISMGFDIVDGPELETDYYNFETMNIEPNHPARDAHDTFWVDIPKMLLRTQTSSVQAHQMETRTLPLAIFATGRCYRNEATDASHDFMFTQGECLYIDKHVSMANLLGTTKLFLQKIFGSKQITMRVRPGYFPFVEPGVEIDASCPFCNQAGCSLCKKTGWIELLGAGLVHPNVLKSSNIDPEKYSGFAFGFGIERIAMIKYGITDIRLFHSNNIEFLRQF